MGKSFTEVQDSLKTIPSYLTEEPIKEPEQSLPQLDLWLKQNDCTKAENPTLCYSQTRLILIRQTYQYDALNDHYFAARTVIKNLKSGINAVISSNQSMTSTLTQSYKK